MVRVAHTADLHVRNLSRHDEHRAVFADFVEQCRNEKVEHIFIAGDLFHTKTSGMSPECIELLCETFTNMTDVADVHVMLGNHDFNVCNLSRQDAISPIINALDDPRIHLYKESGVYGFHPGYNWCVFSLYDKGRWNLVKPVKGEVNIACYHGPVRGAFTESDWEIKDGMDLKFFDGFDFVFLGDIHRPQFLDYRGIELVIDSEDLSKYPDAEIVETF